MKKLLLLLFLIPNLVMGGMGQKQMAEPVEGNLFEILGDALNKDKDSKKNKGSKKDISQGQTMGDSIVSHMVPPTNNLVSTEEKIINGEKFHLNIGDFIFDNEKVVFEELIKIFPNNSIKIIYNEQRINGNLIQEFSIFGEKESSIFGDKDIYIMKKYYRDTFLPYFSYFLVPGEDKPKLVILKISYNRSGQEDFHWISNTDYGEQIEKLHGYDFKKNYYMNKLNTSLMDIKKLMLSKDKKEGQANINTLKTDVSTSSSKISATEVESQCSLMHISNKKNINKKGTLKYMDGKNFDGELDRYCIVEYEGGGKYIGNFKDSERHGQGVMTHPESGKFDGQWKNNWMLKGTMTYLNGDKYIGEFGGYGKANGQGTYTKSNGDEYSGIWKDGYNENFANDLPTKKASQNITPTPAQTPKVSIDDAKSQCTDIGFKASTEKFGDCVLELMQ